MRNIMLLFFFLLLLNGCNHSGHEKEELISYSFLTQKADSIQDLIRIAPVPDRTINLAEFAGHRPDFEGTYNFQPDFQIAIDQLAAEGGGTLLVPHNEALNAWKKTAVTYRLRGPIQLKSNIRLLLEPAVRLYFEFDPAAYFPEGKPVISRYEGTTLFTVSPLIRVFNQENVIIEAREGSGAMPEIYGDGEKWQRWSMDGEDSLQQAGVRRSYELVRDVNNQDIPVRDRIFTDLNAHFLRPPMLEFFLSKNIRVEGVHFIDSPFWVVHPVFSENLHFKSLLFDTQVINNDGFDPESSRNILIENIIFNNRDDNVAIKAGRDREGREGADVTGTILENIESPYINNNRIGGPTENIVVRNSVFKGHNAICVGSEMSSGVRNVYVYDNTAPQNVEIAVFLKGSRSRENVYVKNCSFEKVGSLIDFIPNYDGDTTSAFPPRFSNIYLENIVANQAYRGLRIFGWYDQPIQDVYLQDVLVKSVRKKEPALLQVLQANNIHLENVQLEGSSLDGTYDIMEEGVIPPVQR